MKSIGRKTTPGVRDGRVQKKNRAARSTHPYDVDRDIPEIYRERPGTDHRHLLLQRDIVRFVRLLPDWDELARGLNAVVLAHEEPGAMGWYQPGIVAICAWPRELWIDHDPDFVEAHRGIYDRLGISCQRLARWGFRVKYTESAARAFQLLHIFLHELGHHHDRITTRSGRDAARGESYAERYALQYESVIFDRYFDEFGLE
ncbi:MAG: hypothetical protein HZB38_07955 [Planctomycetes bacterium]|nr:hypothetical protein [Planctomycetota bacterium]